MKGKMFVFEGADGVGKSSVVDGVVRKLSEVGQQVESLAFPGNKVGTLGGLVYDIHHPENQKLSLVKPSPAALQTLHIAAHIDAIERIIRPAVENGQIVFLDRFWWSTIVYGIVDGVSEEVLDLLVRAEREVWEDLMPNQLFLIDREKPLREEPKEKWLKWRSGYLDVFKERKEEDNAVLVLNNSSQENCITEIFEKIRAGL